MTKKNISHAAWKLRATAALVLALALSTFPAAFSRAVKAQTPAKASAQTPAKATTSPATESKGGQKEGIKVHGHWTIDVRNPDGKLVTHREFENGLVGADVLASSLKRANTTGEWAIMFESSNGDSEGELPPCDTTVAGRQRQCWMFETTSQIELATPDVPTSSVGRTLHISANTPGVIVLNASAKAAGSGTISTVSTFLLQCNGSIAPSACVTHARSDWDAFAIFTSTGISSLHVAAGQIIQVTVTISFSSAPPT